MKSVARSLLGVAAGCILLPLSMQAAVIYNGGSASVAPGANFDVAFTASVSDLTGDHIYWGNAGFNLTWDADVLQLQLSPVAVGTVLPLDMSHFRSPVSGQLNFNWVADDLGTQVPDGSTLFTVKFTVIGGPGSDANLRFIGSSVARIGLLDAAGNDHGIYTDPTFVNGQINVVPEPVNYSLAALGCVFFGVVAVRYISRKRAAF